MLMNIDSLTIDRVISGHFGVVIRHALESDANERESLREFIRRIASSTEKGNLAMHLPENLPKKIETALKSIIDYLYSTNPKDFFNRSADFATEIQPYLRNMLHSMVYYLDDGMNLKAPEVSKDIDESIKKVLRPDLFQRAISSRRKGTAIPSFERTTEQAHNILNEKINITPYHGLREPIRALSEMKEKFGNKADHPTRILLDQRLYLMEIIGTSDYVASVPGQHLNSAHLPNDNMAMQWCFIPITIIVALMGSSILFLGYRHYYREDNFPLQGPIWPAGLTDLDNSTAGFVPWVGHSGIKFESFENVTFPFSQMYKRNHPRLLKMADMIINARSSADHELFDLGLEQVMNKVHRLIPHKGMMFSECYIYVWAFLAEHGRQTSIIASFGGFTHLTPEQQLKVRALEALRAGLEELLKHAYPRLALHLSCNHADKPEEQLDALEEIIEAEQSTTIYGRDGTEHRYHYRERTQILSDWYRILDEYKIERPFLSPILQEKIDKYKKPIGPEPENAMRAVMHESDCPWWQAPMNHIRNTALGVNKMACEMWKRTSVPSVIHPGTKIAPKVKKFSG